MNLKRRAVNAQNISKMRPLIQYVIGQDDAKKATEPYASAISFIDKMASKNLIHKNNAARQKSRLTNYLNSLSA